MAIYTRTGDAGSTSLFTGQRVSKTHPRVEAYGTLDELNAMLSLCVCAVAEEEQRTLLEALQQHIFWFSAELASDSEQPSPGKRYISSEEIALLEQTIDREMARVPALHQFVLPGRCEAASRLHLARTVARRAERRLVELAAEVTIRQILLRYLNRLSDCPGAQRGSCRSPAPPCDGDRDPLSGRQRVACARRAQSPGRVALLSQAASAHPSGH